MKGKWWIEPWALANTLVDLLQFSGSGATVNQIAETPTQVIPMFPTVPTGSSFSIPLYIPSTKQFPFQRKTKQFPHSNLFFCIFSFLSFGVLITFILLCDKSCMSDRCEDRYRWSNVYLLFLIASWQTCLNLAWTSYLIPMRGEKFWGPFSCFAMVLISLPGPSPLSCWRARRRDPRHKAKHDKMSSFVWTTVSHCQKTNTAAIA